MTQEDKELLLKDLCARLPYGVKFPTKVYFSPTDDFVDRIYTIRSINSDGTCRADEDNEKIDFSIVWSVRPYLFPMSSMTNEQKKYIRSNYTFGATYELFDWLNKNHFDYRGLIEKGLALDATGMGIY